MQNTNRTIQLLNDIILHYSEQAEALGELYAAGEISLTNYTQEIFAKADRISAALETRIKLEAFSGK